MWFLTTCLACYLVVSLAPIVLRWSMQEGLGLEVVPMDGRVYRGCPAKPFRRCSAAATFHRGACCDPEQVGDPARNVDGKATTGRGSCSLTEALADD